MPRFSKAAATTGLVCQCQRWRSQVFNPGIWRIGQAIAPGSFGLSFRPGCWLRDGSARGPALDADRLAAHVERTAGAGPCSGCGLIGELDAAIGEDRVFLIGHGLQQSLEELPYCPPAGQLTGPVIANLLVRSSLRTGRVCPQSPVLLRVPRNATTVASPAPVSVVERGFFGEEFAKRPNSLSI